MDKAYIQKVDIRWADLDPNFHVLHSKYYDFGAFCRMAYFVEKGFSAPVMQQLNIGPILFREECFFRREINFGDEVKINFLVKSFTSGYGRWSVMHEITKGDGILCAIINVDGAWLDLTKRKLALPPETVAPIFEDAPKSPDFMIREK